MCKSAIVCSFGMTEPRSAREAISSESFPGRNTELGQQYFVAIMILFIVISQIKTITNS